jgi:hypothetical protein
VNFVVLGKVVNLNNQVENLRQNNNNLQSNLNMIASNVNQSLDQFTKEQSWISPVEVNDEKTTVGDGQGQAVLNWQIKDYQEGAEVVFHYRQTASEDFKDIPAKNKGAGFFEVNMPMEIKVEPFWEVQVIKSEKYGTSATEMQKPDEQYNSYSYYVSMKKGDIIKSSEITSFDVGYLAKVKYEPIRGNIEINDNTYSISIVENQDYASVLAKFYNGSNVVTTKSMHIPGDQNGLRSYILSYDAGKQSISHLVIQVKYRSGKTFEKNF